MAPVQQEKLPTSLLPLGTAALGPSPSLSHHIFLPNIRFGLHISFPFTSPPPFFFFFRSPLSFLFHSFLSTNVLPLVLPTSLALAIYIFNICFFSYVCIVHVISFNDILYIFNVMSVVILHFTHFKTFFR